MLPALVYGKIFVQIISIYTNNPIALWTMGITVGGALVLVILERFFPYVMYQKFLRDGFFNDFIWYSIVQSYVLGLVIFGIISTIEDYAIFERQQFIRQLPVWVQVVIFFIVHDFYIYWFHRLQHHSKLLWRIHEAHHSTVAVDWLSGSRSHSLEIFINQSIEFFPIVLLASPEVAAIKGCIDAVWGMYIHSNIDTHSGWLQYIVNGPEMHRWHHATDEAAHDKNFSTKLAVWDWLFGTAYFPPGRRPEGYGLQQPFPKNYFVQHIYAFRKFDEQEDS